MRLKELSGKLANAAVVVKLDQAIGGIGQLAMHEAESMDRHVLALRERLLVARRARGLGEFLRDQVDLLPATRARLAHDHRVRRDLWGGLLNRTSTAPFDGATGSSRTPA